MELHDLGGLALALIERIEESCDEAPVVRQAFLIVEVDKGDTLAYFKASTDDRSWVQEAFMEQAQDALFHSGEPVTPDDED